jgi:hypothetical protein
MIQYIQLNTNTRVITGVSSPLLSPPPGSVLLMSTFPAIQSQPANESSSAWFQIMIKGTPSGAYAAYEIIRDKVDGEYLKEAPPLRGPSRHPNSTLTHGSCLAFRGGRLRGRLPAVAQEVLFDHRKVSGAWPGRVPVCIHHDCT